MRHIQINLPNSTKQTKIGNQMQQEIQNEYWIHSTSKEEITIIQLHILIRDRTLDHFCGKARYQ